VANRIEYRKAEDKMKKKGKDRNMTTKIYIYIERHLSNEAQTTYIHTNVCIDSR